MGLLKKKEKEMKELPSLNNIVQKKLSLFITIVNRGQASPILHLFERGGSSAQFVQSGEGTAQKEIYDILGLEDNQKDVVLSFVSEEKIHDLIIELEAYFAGSKHNKGISLTIPLASIIGVRVYQFLADALEDK